MRLRAPRSPARTPELYALVPGSCGIFEEGTLIDSSLSTLPSTIICRCCTDLNERQVDRLSDEGADLLAFHVHRVDGTNNPHFLYHVADNKFMSYWAKIARRRNPALCLSMFGTGSFWTRDAFCAVCCRRTFPDLHGALLADPGASSGFRVRDLLTRIVFVGVLKDETTNADQDAREGAWTLHPVKRLWD